MGFVSKKFIDKRTGEIVTQVPISEFAHFEEYDGHLEAGDVDQITADKLADEADTFGETDRKPDPMVRMVCGTCGSDDVRADAYAEWNEELQQWEVSAVFDKGAVCEPCGGETRIEEVAA